MRILALLPLLLPLAARGADVLTWQEAGKHVGEEATVEGVVAAVHCSPLACSLAFEPTFTRFTAIVQARSFDTFPPAEMESRYEGRRVRVTGTIETIDGKPRVEVSRADALAVVPAAKRPDAPAAASDATEAAPRIDAAQAEVLDRLDELVDRVEVLSDRLVAAEERMAGLLASLDERERNLAAAQAPPPAPGSGAARPAAQSLRSLKRGMSVADVQRLAGRPLGVIDNGNGWETWDYGGGRSITFDQRGRAQSLAGFPSP